ncbi:MAG: phosphonate ABC transporter, permease protein PhnE [Chloroflexi bacterium]|nr:phosphonate ABC transporter, permease protein PhnE [Chloroflexota bacterium]
MKTKAFTPWEHLGSIIKTGALVALLLLFMANLGFLDLSNLVKGLRNSTTFFSELLPPDPSVTPTLSEAMLETIQMAFVGTFLGFVLALPLGILGARNIAPLGVMLGARAFLGLVRSIPVLLWALIFVVIFGLGPVAGTMALALYTLSYLGKLYYEAVEGVNPEVLEAVKGTGCSRLQLVRFAVLPEAANSILSQLLFMLEYNVRSSSVLGFVGAGGIGFYMFSYINIFHYQKLMTAILLTLMVVMLLDFLSTKIRDRFLAPATATH